MAHPAPSGALKFDPIAALREGDRMTLMRHSVRRAMPPSGLARRSAGSTCVDREDDRRSALVLAPPSWRRPQGLAARGVEGDRAGRADAPGGAGRPQAQSACRRSSDEKSSLADQTHAAAVSMFSLGKFSAAKASRRKLGSPSVAPFSGPKPVWRDGCDETRWRNRHAA